MKKIILSGRSENNYSSPAISIIQIEYETVLCGSGGSQPVDFGQNGGAGSDINNNDIEDEGAF